MELLQKTITLPSGYQITLRESNGEDEDVLSRQGDAEDGVSFYNFLSRIITGTSLEGVTRFTPDAIKEWPLADKYHALIESRILSLGYELNFDYTCENPKCKHKTPMVEDLRKYTHDLSKGNPELSDPDHATKPKLLPYGMERTFTETLSNGKVIKFNLLTGLGELKTLLKNKEDISSGDALRTRNLEMQGDNMEWIKMENFRSWPSRIMSEIRKVVESKEIEYSLYTDCKCKKCGKVTSQLILGVPGFFFPSGN